MVENGNGTGLRCSKKRGFWVAKPPFIKLETVNGYGNQRGHRAVLFDDTRITPVKVSPNQVEESWAIDAHDFLDNPAIAQFFVDERERTWRRRWRQSMARGVIHAIVRSLAVAIRFTKN
jgi:hypothetical protein